MQAVSRENISQWIRENEQGLWPGLARERSQARTVRQTRGAGKARPKGLEQHTVWQSAAQERTRQDGAPWVAGAAQSVQRRAREEAAARPKTPWYQRTPRAWFRPLFAALLLVRQQRAAVGWAGRNRGEMASGLAAAGCSGGEATGRSGLAAARCSRGETASGFAAAGSRRGEATGCSGLAAARCSGGAGDD